MKGAKLFNFRPAAFAAVFLCLGVFAGVALVFYELPLWWLIFALPLVFLFPKESVQQTALALLLLVAAFFTGFFLLLNKVDSFQNVTAYSGGEYHVTGTVVSKTETKYGVELWVSDIKVEGKAERGNLIAYLPTAYGEKVTSGNRVLLFGALRTNEVGSANEGIAWKYLADDLRYELYADTCAVTERPFSLFVFIRTRLEFAVEAGMDETTAAVTMAVLTGDDEGIESGLLENMRRGGVAHLFAVSGLHIGALFAFALLLIKKTPLRNAPKWVRFLSVSLLLLFYGGICGFSASVIRAITICLCFYAAKLIGLNKDFLEALGAAALIILLLRPFALFEAGFQLSFASCLGIVLLARPIEKVCNKITGKRANVSPTEQDMNPLTVGQRFRRACVSVLSVGLSAQIATAPLCMAYFGYISCLSSLLNFLFVPIITAAFSTLLSFVCLAAVLPISVSGVILYIPNVAWSALLLLFQTIDFSAFCIEGIAVPTSALICYFLGLSFLSDKWNLSKTVRFILAISCFTLSFSCVFIWNML